MVMKREEIQSKIFDVTANTMCVDEDELSPTNSFISDLNADSLDAVEIIMGIEDKFDIIITDEEADGILTIDNASDLVMKKLAEKE